MAKFGKHDLNVRKERQVEPEDSIEFKADKKEYHKSENQFIADKTSAEVLLAYTKNEKVRGVSIAIAEQNNDTFITIPSPGSINSLNTKVSTTSVRLALKKLYPNESKSGDEIRFPLFKKIVDDIVEGKQESIEDMFDGLNSSPGILADIDIGALGKLLNDPNSKVSDYVSHNANEPKAPDDGKRQLIAMAVAALSMELIEQVSELLKIPNYKAKAEEERLANEEAIKVENTIHAATVILHKSTEPNPSSDTYAVDKAKHTSSVATELDRHTKELAKLGISWKHKLVAGLLKLARAYATFAMIHDIKSAPMREKWDDEVLPIVGEELSEEYAEVMGDLYDNPTEEMILLVEDDSSTDPHRTIMEYSMAYMEQYNGTSTSSNFTPWITYTISSIKGRDLQHLQKGTSATSNFAEVYRAKETYKGASRPGHSVTEYAHGYINPTGNKAYQDVRSKDYVQFDLPNLHSTTKFVPDKIEDFINKNISKDQQIDTNIMDYLDIARSSSADSTEADDYFMSLLHNGHYTPELVCCLINFMVDGDINEAKAILEAMNSVLTPVQFNYGNMFEDILNGLFSGIKNQLLNYVIGELAKFVNKYKGKLSAWLVRIVEKDTFTAFCTPLIDIVQALLKAIDDWHAMLQIFIRDLADYMLTFSIDIEGGVLTLHTANRNLLLRGLISSMLAALKEGKLCNYNSLKQKDIHPDAIAIIAENSRTPLEYTSKAMDQYSEYHHKVYNSAGVDEKDFSIGVFKDPANPDIYGAVSLSRRNDGLSIIDTLVAHSGNCNKIEDDQRNLTLSDIV